MSITISYRGALKNATVLPRLIDELIDIAESMRWKVRIIDDDWRLPVDARLEQTPHGLDIVGNTGLKGVVLSPPGACEPVTLVFTRAGRLCDPIHRAASLESGRRIGRPWLSIATTGASANVHMWICGLLRYLKKQYMPRLEVRDSGGYWSSGNIRVLLRRQALVVRAGAALKNGLVFKPPADHIRGRNAPVEVADDIALRLIQATRRKRNPPKNAEAEPRHRGSKAARKHRGRGRRIDSKG